METWKKRLPGILVSLALAVPSYLAGVKFPIVGGPVIAILVGMILARGLSKYESLDPGITFVSKKVLQWAVILLGFGMDLHVIMKTGAQSLPIIVCTISTSLIVAYVMMKVLKVDSNSTVLIGVGSSICGGSAIAATAPVIGAKDREVAQAISVIFFFNVLAAIFFPMLGRAIGFDTGSGESFGIFAGTAINDTSSVTAAASTWDSMWNLGSATLDKAVTVKLTRTLAIIPITLILAFYRVSKARKANAGADVSVSDNVSIKSVFPMFILWFVVASIITTVSTGAGVDPAFFAPLKTLSKFMIVMAMAAVGLHSDIVKLVKEGGRSIVLGACCWAGITVVSLLMQRVMGIW